VPLPNPSEVIETLQKVHPSLWVTAGGVGFIAFAAGLAFSRGVVRQLVGMCTLASVGVSWYVFRHRMEIFRQLCHGHEHGPPAVPFGRGGSSDLFPVQSGCLPDDGVWLYQSARRSERLEGRAAQRSALQLSDVGGHDGAAAAR
jgi:hypothetical protein